MTVKIELLNPSVAHVMLSTDTLTLVTSINSADKLIDYDVETLGIIGSLADSILRMRYPNQLSHSKPDD